MPSVVGGSTSLAVLDWTINGDVYLSKEPAGTSEGTGMRLVLSTRAHEVSHKVETL